MPGAQARGNRPSPADRAVIAKRRDDAIGLRQAGVDLVTIGRQLKYGKWTEAGQQVTTDRSLAALVANDIQRALDDRRAHLDVTVEAFRTESIERLERLRAGSWSKAIGGSAPHAATVLRIEERIAKLKGADAPVKHELDLGSLDEQVKEAVADILAVVDESARGAQVVTLRES